MSLESVTRDELLERFLRERNLVDEIPIDAAKREQAVTHDPLGVILVRNGFLSQSVLVEALLSVTNDSLVDEELILPHIPSELLQEHRILIAAQTVKAVYVATTSSTTKVRYLLQPYFPSQEIHFIAASHDKIDGYIEKLATINDSESSILEQMLRRAIMNGVSDIHIVPRRESYSIFYRLLGVRHIEHEGPLDEYLTLIARIKDRSKMDLAERRIPQDGGFSIDFNGRIVDLRVATVPGISGEVCVIRILDPDKASQKLDDVGITRLDQWRAGTSRTDGLCLICGPTGSGKTTTLNATVRELDRFGRAIYTAEDPVEYNIPYIGQININPAVGLDFSRALKAFMRADPDIILLGEIRDPDTARNAIKAAETGHLVLATLHTGSIHGAVNRLRDLNIDAHELKYVLRSVLAQKLVRTVCPVCRHQDPECQKCRGTGYAGRTIVSECHYFSDIKEVNQLLESDEVRWQTMIEDAFEKCKAGITDENEFIRVFGVEAEKLLRGEH